MQFVNKYTFVWLPLIILVVSLVLDRDLRHPYGGRSTAAEVRPDLVFLRPRHHVAELHLPFSQALSITRREFFFGTMLAALVTAVLLGAVFGVVGAIERATGGWGVNGYFFAGLGVDRRPRGRGLLRRGGDGALRGRVLGSDALPPLRRSRADAHAVGRGVLLIAALWLVGRMDAWATVWTWLADLGPMGLTAVLAVLTCVLGAASFLTLRAPSPDHRGRRTGAGISRRRPRRCGGG
jgi:hypothetical protein